MIKKIRYNRGGQTAGNCKKKSRIGGRLNWGIPKKILKKAIQFAVIIGLLISPISYSESNAGYKDESTKHDASVEIWSDENAHMDIQFPEWDTQYSVSQMNMSWINENHIELADENTTVDVMLDDLRGTVHSAYNISIYSGTKVKESAYTENYYFSQLDALNKTLLLYKFDRKPLMHASQLNTHFLHLEMVLSNQVLLSVHVKSKEEIDASQWISKFERMSESPVKETMQKTADNRTGVTAIQALPFSAMNKATQVCYDNIFVNSEDVTWGIFDPSTHYELKYVENIENETGISFDIILEYYSLGYLPRLAKMNEISQSGRILELTFQTSIYGEFNGDALYEVLDGQYDEIIDELIYIVKEHDGPILFRPNNEMNGDWCSYNALYAHKDTDVFIAFWQWLYNRFEAEGAENVIWVWNPNWGDFPGISWNHYMEYFPGAEYVDVIGLTGYNTGTYYPSEYWRSFSEIYLPMIWEYNMHFTGYPYMITEFGSSQTGGDKSAWIEDAVNQIGDIGIQAAVWWNYVDYDTQNGVVSRDYKFDDDPEVMNVFRNHFRLIPAE